MTTEAHQIAMVEQMAQAYKQRHSEDFSGTFQNLQRLREQYAHAKVVSSQMRSRIERENTDLFQRFDALQTRYQRALETAQRIHAVRRQKMAAASAAMAGGGGGGGGGSGENDSLAGPEESGSKSAVSPRRSGDAWQGLIKSAAGAGPTTTTATSGAGSIGKKASKGKRAKKRGGGGGGGEAGAAATAATPGGGGGDASGSPNKDGPPPTAAAVTKRRSRPPTVAERHAAARTLQSFWFQCVGSAHRLRHAQLGNLYAAAHDKLTMQLQMVTDIVSQFGVIDDALESCMTCVHCFEVLDDPVVYWPCGHYVCRACSTQPVPKAGASTTGETAAAAAAAAAQPQAQ
eukprot:g3751.t1